MLQFRSYFGRNWDALDECITDLEWLPGKAYILFVSYANDALGGQDRAFNILLSVIENAAQEWAERTGTMSYDFV